MDAKRKQVIFHQIHRIRLHAAQAAFEKPHDAFIRIAARFHFQHGPHKLNDRMEQDIFLLVNKKRDFKLLKNFFRIIRIGRHIPCYNGHVDIAVMLLRYQPADFACHIAQLIFGLEQAAYPDFFLLPAVFLRTPSKQVLFQMKNSRRIPVPLFPAVSQHHRRKHFHALAHGRFLQRLHRLAA